jgi:patatin-like phospholipase/acyl hydrolase
MASHDIRRALSFDGGGIRGLFQARLLAEWEHLNIIQQCHLFAGTSTGAIVAACLALGKTATEIRTLYENLGEQLFAKKWYWRIRPLIGRPVYSSALLKELLKTGIPENAKLGDCLKRTIIVATRLNDLSCCVFDSECNFDKQKSLLDVVMASAAAPYFFCPHFVDEDQSLYVDGGLTCNNPSFQCVSLLIKEGATRNDIRVLSVANGRDPHMPDPLKYANIHAIRWRSRFLRICMAVSSDHAHKQCQSLLPNENYLRIDPVLNENIALDDYRRATRVLKPLASIVGKDQGGEIRKWLTGISL